MIRTMVYMCYYKMQCIIIVSCTTVTHNDILYTGMMYYYEKKEFGHCREWKAIYSVVNNLDTLKQVIMQST